MIEKNVILCLLEMSALGTTLMTVPKTVISAVKDSVSQCAENPKLIVIQNTRAQYYATSFNFLFFSFFVIHI